MIQYFLLISSFVGGCVSSKEGQVIRDDLFTMQSRLSELESNLQQKEKSLRSDSETANQRVASTSTRLDALEQNIQRIRGDIDALKIGVSTGKMPGTEAHEDSIAQKVSDLSTRLEAIEANQSTLLETIDKNAKAPKKAEKDPKDKVNKESNAEPPKNIDELQKAFSAKKYKFVAEQGPVLLSSVKGKAQKLTTQFLIAESLYHLGKPKEAAIQYSEYLDRGAERSKVPYAKLKIADCFKQMGDKATAKLFYEEVLAKYSKSPQAEQARRSLSALSDGA